jgi:ATP-dependent protease Clp ATPase subunit
MVEVLNKYIVGQEEAKKALAVALRNRWRRQQLSGSMKKDIIPKNILMVCYSLAEYMYSSLNTLIILLLNYRFLCSYLYYK